MTAKWRAVEGVGMGFGLTNVVKSIPELELPKAALIINARD
jgi:hypothetical protein